jgi:hypothetical protein
MLNDKVVLPHSESLEGPPKFFNSVRDNPHEIVVCICVHIPFASQILISWLPHFSIFSSGQPSETRAVTINLKHQTYIINVVIAIDHLSCQLRRFAKPPLYRDPLSNVEETSATTSVVNDGFFANLSGSSRT